MSRRFLYVLVPTAVVVLTATLLVGLRLLFPAARQGFADPQAGRDLFWGRGGCAGCHALAGDGGIRCPDLGTGTGTLLERSGARVAGLDPVAYLVQSIVDPDAHTVPGYPARLMPPAELPPVSLHEADVASLVAFLATSDGGALPGPELSGRIRDAQARYRTGAARGGVARAGAVRDRDREAPGDPTRGRLVFERMHCGACHVVAGVTPDGEGEAEAALRRGPVLTGIGAFQGEGYLEEAVWSPDAVVVPGPGGEWLSDDGHTSRMPSYREVMTRDQLADLVAFLALLR